MADVQKYPERSERGRAHRATPLPPSYRFVAINDNRPPRRPIVLRLLFLAIVALAIGAIWYGLGRF